MRVNLGKFFDSLPKPAPAKTKVLAGASDIVAKAELVSELNGLPENGYAILVMMVPDENGLMIRSQHYPANRDDVVYHGLYNYCAEYFARRVHGTLDD